jgi:uncharacterized protein
MQEGEIMNFIFYVIFITALILYSGVNYYIGLRGWQAFGFLFPKGFHIIYWMVLCILSFSYIIGRFGKRVLSVPMSNLLNRIGSYWIGAMVYFIILVVLADLFRVINRWTGILPVKAGQEVWVQFYAGAVVLFLTLSLMIYGFFNARNPKVSHYEIKISKKAGQIKKLNAVMVSDIHLGIIMDHKRLTIMVDKINQLKPDIIVFPGDIIDENIQPFIDQEMSFILQGLHAELGIYATFGNHEYYGGYLEEIYDHLKNSGVHVLRDEYVKIQDSFYIVGREDETFERFTGKKRKELEETLKEIEPSLPVILLQHQPNNIMEHKTKGIDLQLSGHTHGGQFFPFNFITKKIYEIDFGLLKLDNFHIIVSSGFGTWGPPIRVGNRPEIVHVVLQFLDS